MQSTFQSSTPTPFHVAIIMDGNGRWARQRGLARIEGHREGAKTVQRVVEAAPDLGITTLTLYAFSSDNWRRPETEVNGLMRLFLKHLHSERNKCIDNGVRLSVIGRRDRLSLPLRTAIKATESATAHGQTLHLQLAIDYSARDSILRAAARLSPGIEPSRETFSLLLAEANHISGDSPDVDLLIRTGGEQRLSDFLLWESAYAELVFTERMWPDFDVDDLKAAIDQFHRRERRFGTVPKAVAC
ncbi:MAG: di-trans,poly-cis-decaprenylcistransferase [bacterium]